MNKSKANRTNSSYLEDGSKCKKLEKIFQPLEGGNYFQLERAQNVIRRKKVLPSLADEWHRSVGDCTTICFGKKTTLLSARTPYRE